MKKVLLIIMFLLFSIMVFAQSNWVDYCKNDDTGNGVYCAETGKVLEAENNLRATKNTDSVGTAFQPLVFDWNLDGEDEIIFITSTGNLRSYNLEMVLRSDSIGFPSPLTQPVLVNMFDANSTKDTQDKKQFVYRADNNTGDDHHDLILINRTNTSFVLHKIIPLIDKNETSGITCFDYDDDGVVECFYIQRSGMVRAYQENATSATDSEINRDLCGGDIGTQNTGGVQVSTGLMIDVPHGDIDGDGDEDLFFGCKTSVVSIDSNDQVFFNTTFLGGAQAIDDIRLANVDGGNDLEVVVVSQTLFGSCGGVSLSGQILVANNVGTILRSTSTNCLVAADQGFTSRPIILKDFTDSDVFDEILFFRSRSGTNILNDFITWDDFESISSGIEIITSSPSFSTIANDLFVPVRMPESLAKDNPIFINGVGYWLYNFQSVFDIYRARRVFNYSDDFTFTSFGQPFDTPVVSIIDNHAGVVHSSAVITVSYTGMEELVEIVIPTDDEQDNWYHYQKEQDEDNNRFSTGIHDSISGRWDSNIDEIQRQISKGGETSQHLIADLDNDSLKEVYIIDGNKLFVFSFNTTLNIFEQVTFKDFGDNINQQLNIHKFPTRPSFVLTVFSGDNVSYITFADKQLTEVCNEGDLGKTPIDTTPTFGTSCHDGFCLSTSTELVTVIDRDCNIVGTLNQSSETERFLRQQTLAFGDTTSGDNDLNIFGFTISASQVDIHEFRIDQDTGSGSFGTTGDNGEVLFNDLYDDTKVTSIILAETGDGGQPELIVIGKNEFPLFLDHDYGFAVIETDSKDTFQWGDSLGSAKDLRFCREAQSSIFQPTLAFHPNGKNNGLDYNVVCGACIPEQPTALEEVEGQLIAGCRDLDDGDLVVAPVCDLPSSTCNLGFYGGINATQEIEKPTMTSGNFDVSTVNDEILIGNVLATINMERIRTFGNQRLVYSSVSSVIPKNIVDSDFVFSISGGNPTTSVFSTVEENTAPVITKVENCPQLPVCLTTANTTGVNIRAEFFDSDNDDIFFNLTNNTGESSNYTSDGGEGEFTRFIKFFTTGNKQVTINVRDDLFNVDTQVLEFSIIDDVAPFCNIDFNECTTQNTTPEAPISPELIEEPDTQVNAKVALTNVATAFGLSLTILALILIGVGIVGAHQKTGSNIIAGLIGVVMFLIAISFGFISPVVIFIATLVVVLFVVYAVFFHGGTKGGAGAGGQ